METFSALLAICAENSPVPGEFSTQKPVTRRFGVFFDLRLNKRLSKQSCGWWFEPLSSSLWRHSNDVCILLHQSKTVWYYHCELWIDRWTIIILLMNISHKWIRQQWQWQYLLRPVTTIFPVSVCGWLLYGKYFSPPYHTCSANSFAYVLITPLQNDGRASKCERTQTLEKKSSWQTRVRVRLHKMHRMLYIQNQSWYSTEVQQFNNTCNSEVQNILVHLPLISSILGG